MRIAHFAMFGVNQCGLYHTAKDLVLAERQCGIDARFIAFDTKYQGIHKDGDFTTEDINWAFGADILVRHTAIPENLHNAGIPIVMALHGRPESSFRLEEHKERPLMTGFYDKRNDKRYKAFVTFWPEYVDIWSHILPNIKCVPVPVDLDLYNPNVKPYDLGELKGDVNVLVCDIWRDDVIPFNVFFAAVKFAEKHNGKVHIVGLTKEAMIPMSPFIAELRKKNLLGLVYGQTKDIRNLYTACDIMVTPHVIATRTVREALASGLKIVGGSGNRYTPFVANPMDVDSFAEQIEKCWQDKDFNPRKVAEENFNFKNTGESIKKIFEGIISKPKTNHKVFIDIGGHLGESVRRFYREVEDAADYKIYSFEPDKKTFGELVKNVGYIKNVKTINACVNGVDGLVDFYVGKDNQNEGGTLVKGKQTGGIDYGKPTKVNSLNFSKWFRENIPDGDKVILKMNIEGGEYSLMELLLKENLTERISKCFIQLHSHKFPPNQQRWDFQDTEKKFWQNAKCKTYMTSKGNYSFNV